MKNPDPQPGMMLEKFRGEVPTFELDEPYQAFLDGAKLDSPETQLALSISSNKKFKEFLRQIKLPSNANKKSSAIAKKIDITLAEWMDLMRDSGRMRSLSIAARRLPEITEHMADDALTQKKACGRCDGWGFVNVKPEEMPPLDDNQPIPGGVRPMGARWVRDCPQCDGTGKLKEAGDSHAREKILLMNGISNKSAAVTVAINNYNGHGIEAAGNKLSALTFDVSAEEIHEGGDPQSTGDWRDSNLSGESPADGAAE